MFYCVVYWLFLPWSVNDTFTSPSISNYYHDLEGRQWGHSIKPTHYTPYHRSCTEGAWWIYMKHYHKSLILVQLLLFTPFIIVYSIRLFMYISFFLLLTNDKIMMMVLKLIIESLALMTLNGASTNATTGAVCFFFLAYWSFLSVVKIMVVNNTVIQNPLCLEKGFF